MQERRKATTSSGCDGHPSCAEERLSAAMTSLFFRCIFLSQNPSKTRQASAASKPPLLLCLSIQQCSILLTSTNRISRTYACTEPISMLSSRCNAVSARNVRTNESVKVEVNSSFPFLECRDFCLSKAATHKHKNEF